MFTGSRGSAVSSMLRKCDTSSPNAAIGGSARHVLAASLCVRFIEYVKFRHYLPVWSRQGG